MHHPPHLDIDIDKLITDENDPKFRVLLVLVKSLSDYLASNTEAVNDMSEAERSQMMQIMRANGIWKPIFISLLPRAGTAIEQDHMIYGKRKNTPMDLPYFATFAHSMEIESW